MALQQSLNQVAASSIDDEDPEERRRQRELAAKAIEEERIARISYIKQIQAVRAFDRRCVDVLNFSFS